MTNIEEIKASWKSQNEKLEKNLRINMEILRKMNLDKIHSAFNKFNRAPISGIIVGMIVNVYMMLFIYNNSEAPGLIAMASIILILTMMQTIFGIYQLTIINELELDDSVIKNQKILAKLNRDRLQYVIITRFMYAVLWLPVTIVLVQMFFDTNLFLFLDQLWLMINGFIIVAFGIFGFWLSFKFSRDEINNDKLIKLVNSISRSDYIGQKLRDAISLLEELEQFENEM